MATPSKTVSITNAAPGTTGTGAASASHLRSSLSPASTLSNVTSLPFTSNPNVSAANMSSASSPVASTRTQSQVLFINLYAVFANHATAPNGAATVATSPTVTTPYATTDTDTDNETLAQSTISIDALRSLFGINKNTPFEERQKFQNAVTLAVSQSPPQHDSNHDGEKFYFNTVHQLTFQQFFNFFVDMHVRSPPSCSSLQLFSHLDPDGDGLVTPKDLQVLLSNFGMRFTDDQVQAMTDYISCSLNSPGFNRDEFINTVSSLTPFPPSDESS